jgi:hypothetical protein
MQQDKKEWDPRALGRLLDDVRPYHVDPGKLGEYVSALRSHGPKKAASWFPDIAGHLQSGCPECNSEIESIQQILDEESPVEIPNQGEEPILETLEPLVLYDCVSSAPKQYSLSTEEMAQYERLLKELQSFNDRIRHDLEPAFTKYQHILEEISAFLSQMPDLHSEEFANLLCKLPWHERDNFESLLENAIECLAHEREDLLRQAHRMEEKLNIIHGLLKALRKPNQ